jgi:hypothetical protein
LLSLPFTPSTYHVVLAEAVGTRARSNTKGKKLLSIDLFFMISPSVLLLKFRSTQQVN